VITLTATGGAAGTGATLNWYTGLCGETWIGSGSPLVIDSPTSTTSYRARWESSCGASACDLVKITVESVDSILYVKPGGTGACGRSWSSAFGDLRLALAAAGSDGSVEQIWVAEGTYKPTSGSDRSATFTLVGGVEVYGGFSGSETSLSQRNVESNPTILSGDLLVLANFAYFNQCDGDADNDGDTDIDDLLFVLGNID
jgi:hypothetical protein